MNNTKTSKSRSFKKTFQDVTAQKTARIKHLQRVVQDAQLELAEAEATFESFEAKAELFAALLANAQNKLGVMTTQDNMATDASQKVQSLFHTATAAISTANDTYSDTQNLLKAVQKVVEATLSAATDIVQSAELIMTRKAANPLISSQLVTDAAQAATDASKTVSLIINALTATFNALSTANQASNTAEIVQAEIIYLKDLVVGSKAGAAGLVSAADMTIEDQTGSNYSQARDYEKESQMASDQANQQMIKAKNDLTRATANLANSQSALSAAEAAVGS